MVKNRELKQWMDFALDCFPNRSYEVRTFHTNHVAPEIRILIMQRLASAKTKDDIKAAFVSTQRLPDIIDHLAESFAEAACETEETLRQELELDGYNYNDLQKRGFEFMEQLYQERMRKTNEGD